MSDYPEGSYGVPDALNLVESADHWLETGLTTRLVPALNEQSLVDHNERLASLATAWKARTGLSPGDGPYQRGHGWRVWLGNGQVFDSRTTAWVDVPDGIIIGVSYDGTRRIIAEGMAPYWVSKEGLLYDSRVYYPDNRENPRWTTADPGPMKRGIYISDAAMREARWQTALSFCLSEVESRTNIVDKQGGHHGRYEQNQDDRARDRGQVRPHP